MTKVGLVSLGCAKNLIDSEIMIGHLQQAGMAMTPQAEDADVLIINTCSFIDMAKKESIASVHEAVDGRAEGGKVRAKQKIIVAGCMAQRFAQELPNLMPEVDAFIGLDQLTKVAPIIEGLMGKKREEDEAPENHVTEKPQYIPDYDTPRFRLTPKHTAYIKIAEGCNHPCSFCIIPKIRGKHRSRTQESVVFEAKALIKSGVKEINLISQDTTYFGMDKWEGQRPNPRSGVDSSRGESLATLIRELNALEGDFWIRLLYTHPAHWSDELIQAVAECEKVVKYVDIPLQHISDNMLTLMKRETNGAYIRELIQRMRTGIPDIAIRTTFIVGFPGETEADFEELVQFIEETKFERAGVFNYSREEGTRADKMEGHLHHSTRKRRWNEAMRVLQHRAEEFNASQLGRTYRVLVENPGEGRSYMDSIDIDGVVFVDPALPVGEFAEVTISDWRGYDLVAQGGLNGRDGGREAFRERVPKMAQ
ncbi:30S ribosomal protein S12 methylthiotransferase RimO [Verrucomicrobium sp. BvORR034]|uniref:30S ribosomal protein S12 methylthiotransferase RimO n=1 Tax=Verrucomicrobium sp. BvORR034 TaxID=1396418 RepID=UPI000679011A|nr:30S ribosomal protein S12 methylthiotransferase RimO [Verrucomicrobium sp. BvORR034]